MLKLFFLSAQTSATFGKLQGLLPSAEHRNERSAQIAFRHQFFSQQKIAPKAIWSHCQLASTSGLARSGLISPACHLENGSQQSHRHDTQDTALEPPQSQEVFRVRRTAHPRELHSISVSPCEIWSVKGSDCGTLLLSSEQWMRILGTAHSLKNPPYNRHILETFFLEARSSVMICTSSLEAFQHLQLMPSIAINGFGGNVVAPLGACGCESVHNPNWLGSRNHGAGSRRHRRSEKSGNEFAIRRIAITCCRRQVAAPPLRGFPLLKAEQKDLSHGQNRVVLG